MLTWPSDDAFTDVQLGQHMLLFWRTFRRYLPAERYILSLPPKWGGFGIPVGFKWCSVPAHHREVIAYAESPGRSIADYLTIRRVLSIITRDRNLYRGHKLVIDNLFGVDYIYRTLVEYGNLAPRHATEGSASAALCRDILSGRNLNCDRLRLVGDPVPFGHEPGRWPEDAGVASPIADFMSSDQWYSILFDDFNNYRYWSWVATMFR
jgi:hypothetical protein